MTAQAHKRTLWDVIVIEPLELAKAQPHQILLSTGSVTIMAQYAASDGIVSPLVGLCIAVGVEWAWLRGMASDSKASSIWGSLLNWSAFLIAAVWGVLWVCRLTGVTAERVTGGWGAVLAAMHIVPIAWLALCSAMCHRAALLAAHRADDQAAERERARLRAIEDQRLRFEQEQAAAEAEARRRREDLEHRVRLKMQMQNAPARSARAPHSNEEDAPAKQYACPRCGASLSMKAYAAARRWGHCAACKEEA